MRLECEYGAAAIGSQMVLPLLQPLRLWSPREERVSARRVVVSKKDDVSSPGFRMKGGFVTVAGGERRLMIAGKIFKAVTN
ncbi:MAG TPA: hypothetical protein VHO70_13425 [Chitinispirillaceae bacterium]|nr:hypothetical protein [Chitinispirillaceae bacterium]